MSLPYLVGLDTVWPAAVRWVKLAAWAIVAEQDITAFVNQFREYSIVWNPQREVELKTFLDADPHLSDFEEKFRFYDELEKRFSSEPDSVVIGPIAIHTGNMNRFLGSTP